MAKWNDERDAVLADIKAQQAGLGALESRVASLETGQPHPQPTPPDSLVSLEDQRVIKELYDKWERVALRFEAGGITFDWRDSDNGPHHLDRDDPDQFKPTLAEAYDVWLERSEGTRVAKRN